MRKILIAGALALSLSPAAAQGPVPGVLEKAIVVMQSQRNQALDAQANAETRALLCTDEVTKLKAELEELRKKLEPKPE